jgi:hypothetical protein
MRWLIVIAFWVLAFAAAWAVDSLHGQNAQDRCAGLAFVGASPSRH